jgi:hypothetical protein
MVIMNTNDWTDLGLPLIRLVCFTGGGVFLLPRMIATVHGIRVKELAINGKTKGIRERAQRIHDSTVKR